MTTFEQLDQALAARGWRYDTGHEDFFNGTEPLLPEEVIALVPEMTLDELASYQDAKYDDLARRKADAGT